MLGVNKLHALTELDNLFWEVDTVINSTGLGGLICLFNVADCHDNSLVTVDEANQYDNISIFEDESIVTI